MRKIIRLPFLILVSITIFWACNDIKQQQETKATILLNQAKEHYQAKRFEEALVSIDSLYTKYPYAMGIRMMAKRLSDSIERDASQAQLDSLTVSINNLKIKILKSNDPKKVAEYNIYIDSLQALKTPFRDSINAVNGRELQNAARNQCITCIQTITK